MDIFSQVFGVNPQQAQQGRFQRGPAKFERIFKAKPLSYFPGFKKDEGGNKILLPPSALDQLSRMNIQYPMMFKITNSQKSKTTGKKRFSHCSVLEFTATEGEVFLPLCMIHNLHLPVDGSGFVKLENVSLPKGSFARFQPYKYEFVTDIPNHKVVLEKTLRGYACLTKGDVVEIKFLDKCHDLEVIELKPADVVSIIETDMSVDFAPPKTGAPKQWTPTTQNAPHKAQEMQEDSSDDEDEFGSRAPRVLNKTRDVGHSGYRLKDGKSIEKDSAPSPAQNQFKTEEEVVGNYRFIYRVNVATGERECIRRLPNRQKTAFAGNGNSLKR